MKRVFIACLLFLAVLASCTKSGFNGNSVAENIIGRWNYTQSYASPGSGYIYTSTANLKQWIEFRTDGSFSTNMPDFAKVTRYQMQDTLIIKFTEPASATPRRYSIMLKSSDHSLTLSSADFICIEGCGQIFTKQQ